MCHGAGGMAAYTAFGSRSGGSTVIFGLTLAILALCFGGSIEFLLQAVPMAVLGTVLFLAGGQLVHGNLPRFADRRLLLTVLLTAAAATWNVAFGFLAGLFVHWLVNLRRD